ncbi:type I phosphodiesterase / nucleotide pyrophosphatase family protein [Novosphingobium sp. Rr 2-17]|uniref:alkaline phosphatase family protein n=1 Tax=Novosphingobium sp. Rr 2-17 TaxID=555793 RepID=UPI0002697E47|nr:ectonucleotide pyrophosphatase/phosphodiesterase [Novosphingobium sp. Rr 2-17]EIZ80738.1 type I phosphodiesterase / nucleotide pyrophosphatase family protein [Novosphingobium sp. Rr 2-17]
MLRFLLCLITGIAALFPCVPVAAHPRQSPVVILVSIDGFRADYLQRGVTPNLSALAAHGISAAMRPSFPSKTFPNHWAIATGKVPDHNGIVANRFEDPRRPGEVFTMASEDPFWWSEAEPLWVSAEKAGIRTAAMFWPGSTIAWGGTRIEKPWPHDDGGTRPQDWQHFDGAVTPVQRVETVLDWMRRPAKVRPRFVTLYFDTVDTAGHNYGPDDPRTTQAVAQVDRTIGSLIAGLRKIGRKADLVIVADHGMAATSSERVVALDTIVDASLYSVVETGPFATLKPTNGNADKLANALLAPHEHMTCWPREAIPARLRYGANPRIAPWFCLADVGWQVLPTRPAEASTGGSHGYDNAAPEMAALFVAAGPGIARRGSLASFDNVDVTALLRDLLGMPADAGADGTDLPFRQALRH